MAGDPFESSGVKDAKVLAAVRRIRRELFVPEEAREEAGEDKPLPIGEGQTISQPSLVALMTELLELKGPERVLEVGSGSGYQAAILAEIVSEVFTVEILPGLAERSRRTLERAGYRNIHFRTGNGRDGWPEEAPFDAIVVTAAPRETPAPLLDQLAEGGRLVVPLGGGPDQDLVRLTKLGGRFQRETIMPVRFVPFLEETGC
jgi:protein-L-isoaspartate(D-aspartate) O-methyltransferase